MSPTILSQYLSTSHKLRFLLPPERHVPIVNRGSAHQGPCLWLPPDPNITGLLQLLLWDDEPMGGWTHISFLSFWKFGRYRYIWLIKKVMVLRGYCLQWLIKQFLLYRLFSPSLTILFIPTLSISSSSTIPLSSNTPPIFPLLPFPLYHLTSPFSFYPPFQSSPPLLAPELSDGISSFHAHRL